MTPEEVIHVFTATTVVGPLTLIVIGVWGVFPAAADIWTPAPADIEAWTPAARNTAAWAA